MPSSSLPSGPTNVPVEKGETTVLGRKATYTVYARTQGRKQREVIVGLYRAGDDEKLATTFSSRVFVERGMFTGLFERLTGREFDPIDTDEQVQQVLDDAREYVAKERSTRDEFRDGSTDTGVVECSFGCGRQVHPEELKPTGWIVDAGVTNRDDVFHACPRHVDVLRGLQDLDGFDDAKEALRTLEELGGVEA